MRELTVVRRTRRFPDPRNYGCATKDDVTVQELLERVQRRLGPLRWTEVKRVAEEVVPQPVMVCLGAFGDTGGWRSKFSGVIAAGGTRGNWARL